jgi:oxaloacetate decarboxylase beta subunit
VDKSNKKKSPLGVNRAWWITFGTIVFAIFFMGSKTGETVKSDAQQESQMDKLVNKTGINAFIEGFQEFGMSEEQLAERHLQQETRLARLNREAQARLDMTAEAQKHKKGIFPNGVGQIVMIFIGLLLIYLAIAKGFEPLLLLPIGFGGILANIPVIGMAHVAEIVGQPDGFLNIIYSMGIENGLFPLFIFMGVGAMTDFGPLIANPKTALLGAAAQFGIFTTLLGALWLSSMTDLLNYNLHDAAAIGIIGGADGPTSIFVASRLSPGLLGAIAVAAYSYMALVPIIQPPIMNLLTTKAERMIKMEQLRPVGRLEKISFPLIVLFLCILLLPDATPLIGCLMFGNLAKESGVVDRLSDTIQNSFINIVTILLGLAVGSKLSAEKFLSAETLGILFLGVIAFSIGTAAGVLLAKLMNKLTSKPINPLIGAAGVSAVPMAARVANKVGLDNNPQNFLLMHAMGPNVSGVIGSAVAAGVLLALV